MRNKTATFALLTCLLTGAVCLFIGPLKSGQGYTISSCYPTATPGFAEQNIINPPDSNNYQCPSSYSGYPMSSYGLTKHFYWDVSWPNSANPHGVTVTGRGKWVLKLPSGPHKYCWPDFYTPETGDRLWVQRT